MLNTGLHDLSYCDRNGWWGEPGGISLCRAPDQSLIDQIGSGPFEGPFLLERLSAELAK
jgi:hypothetical protein